MSDSKLETLEHGTQRYTLDDGQIVVVVGSGDMRRNTVDEWAEVMVASFNSFPPTQPVYLLLDASHPNQGFTPYARIKADEILQRIDKTRPVFFAIVFRDTVMNTVISMFLNRVVRVIYANDYLTYKAFNKLEDAIEWLREVRQS